MSPPLERGVPGHAMQLYEDEKFLIEALTRFAVGGLAAGDCLVLIATPPHLASLEAELSSRGFDLPRARGDGRYVELDAAATLAQLLVDGRPDRARFAEVVGSAVARAGERSGGRVRAFGEMMVSLVADLRRDTAVELEGLWNELSEARELSVLCAYPVSAFAGPDDERSFLEVCCAHAAVMPAESYAALALAEDRTRAVAELQRKAAMLEAEVRQRREAEETRQRALQQLSKLHDIGRILFAELDLQRLLQALTDAATELAGAEFGAFFYNALDENGGHELLFTLSGAPREAFDRLGMPRKTALLAPTFDGEGVVRLDDVGKDPRYGRNAPLRGLPLGHLPIAAYLAVPVTSRTGEAFGGLLLGHSKAGVFGEDAERGVSALARQTAVAIENARLYHAERLARGEAEAANRAKDEFIAMLGHELRNPLSAVRNSVVTARLDPQRRDRALEIGRRAVEQLVRLVEDLLDVARISNGKIALRREPLPFAGVVQRAVEAARPLLEEHGHRIRVETLAPDLWVNGDPLRLEQIAVNLLSNAAKYTPPGGHILVSIERDGELALLRVRDDGIGIAAEMLPRVFDLFTQSERALDRAEGGLGIGLTVVKRLVELHGGRVEARSEGPGRGAEFVIRLPEELGDRPPAAPSEPKLVPQPGARVLVVEDNEDVADSLGMLLELLGHRVTIARDGPSALELALASSPDLMLTDIGLPGMDGFELARRVRNEPALSKVMLVALTGYGRDRERERAREAGFDHHLVKPVSPESLQTLVAQLPVARG